MAVTKLFKLVEKFKKVVNETFAFPTALVIQWNVPGKYLVAGNLSSRNYPVVSLIRTFAFHGFNKETVQCVAGGNQMIVNSIVSTRNSAAVATTLLSNRHRQFKALQVQKAHVEKKKGKRKRVLEMDNERNEGANILSNLKFTVKARKKAPEKKQ